MTTKTERLLTSLQNGTELSVAQIQRRFGFASPQSVTSVIRNLRTEGYAVYANTTKNGVTKYRIGTPSRKIVAAGYALLGAAA
jgi:SOS-response transcriptional repressor LexA